MPSDTGGKCTGNACKRNPPLMAVLRGNSRKINALFPLHTNACKSLSPLFFEKNLASPACYVLKDEGVRFLSSSRVKNTRCCWVGAGLGFPLHHVPLPRGERGPNRMTHSSLSPSRERDEYPHRMTNSPLPSREGSGVGEPAMKPRHPLHGRAGELRHNLTDAERRLWQHLRNSQMEGVKFRRQQPIEMYIVDFVSFDKRIVIEPDGRQHAEAGCRDQQRDACLAMNGFSILRFWNNEVFENLEGVLEVIRQRCL